MELYLERAPAILENGTHEGIKTIPAVMATIHVDDPQRRDLDQRMDTATEIVKVTSHLATTVEVEAGVLEEIDHHTTAGQRVVK